MGTNDMFIKNKKTFKAKRSGFTLTEVAVASTLLAISIVPILKALTAMHFDSVRIEQKTRTLALAQAKLDEIKVRAIYNYSGTFQSRNEVLEGSYRAVITDTVAGGNMRAVTISAGYDDSGNNALSADEVEVTLATYIAKRW